jgi:hypothetical protein
MVASKGPTEPGITTPDQNVAPGDKTTISQKGPAKSHHKQTEAVSVPDTRDGLSSVFSFISTVVGSDVQFESRDFEAEARGLASASKKVPGIGQLMPFLSPLVVVAGFVQKLQSINEGRAATKARKAAAAAEAQNPVVFPPQNTPGGGPHFG